MIKNEFVVMSLVIFLSACTDMPTDPKQSMPDTWDLVFVSASNGWLVPEKYAALIEEDQSVTVNIYDLTIGGLSAGEVLDSFEDEGRLAQRIHHETADFEDPLDLFANAEVIVISIFDEGDSVPADVEDAWLCLAPPPGSYVESCDMVDYEPYFDDIRAILDRLFDLRAGQPTIVRAFDLYGRPAWWQADDPGVYEACSTCWITYVESYAAVLAEYNIPVAPVHQVWSEPDYQGDPEDKGFIGFDYEHPSHDGAQSMAQLLHELGYTITEPPSP